MGQGWLEVDPAGSLIGAGRSAGWGLLGLGQAMLKGSPAALRLTRRQTGRLAHHLQLGVRKTPAHGARSLNGKTLDVGLFWLNRRHRSLPTDLSRQCLLDSPPS